MSDTIEFLTTYGYTALFTCVLVEQLGIPVPATPILIAAGAFAGLGKMNLLVALLLAVAGSLIGDSVWYYLGKMRGMSVLRLLCKISLEQDACVRRTNSTYSRHGSRWLLFAKFIPGVSTLAPPMAGIYGLSPWRFIAMDSAGSALWAGVFILAGWCFRGQTYLNAAYMDGLGKWLGSGLAGAIAIYIVFKYIERKRVYRSLQIDRIAPLELKQRIESGEAIMILDLRTGTGWLWMTLMALRCSFTS